MGSLVLALFPGIGLLDRVFEGEGFCVVRGPDVLWGGDIRRFHPSAGVFVAAPDRSKQRTVGTYVWDPTDWQLYIQRGRNQQEVCNFLPEILGDIEIDKSDGNVTRAWGCRFTLRDGKKVEFYLPAEDRGFSKLSDALSRRCPADYVVEPAMQDHLRSAMPKRSYGTWRRSREFATLGAAGQVFLKFVREVFGDEAYAQVIGWMRPTITSLGLGAKAQGVLVEEASPFRQLARAIVEAMAARRACVWPAEGLTAVRTRIPDVPQVPIVGYYLERDGGKLALLTARTTYKWYCEREIRHGDVAGFAWRSVTHDVIDHHGGVRADRVRVRADQSSDSPQVMGVMVTLQRLIDVGDGEVDNAANSGEDVSP